MTKSQQTLLNTFNQNTVNQFKDVIEIYNNPLLLSQLMASNKSQEQTENLTAGRSAKQNNSNPIASILFGPLYEFQQETLQKQQNEIEFYKKSYNKILVQCNEMSMKLEKCQKSLELEVILPVKKLLFIKTIEVQLILRRFR